MGGILYVVAHRLRMGRRMLGENLLVQHVRVLFLTQSYMNNFDSDGTVDITPSYDLWDSIIWPKLYSLSSAFGSAKVLNQWAGWYEYNVIDQNGIVGFHPGCGNLVVANGFSGHGLQMSPAVGRAVAELVEGGRFETICLKRFGVERFEKGEEIFEEGIV